MRWCGASRLRRSARATLERYHLGDSLMKRSVVVAAAGLLLWAAGGCNLIDSNGLHIGYSFDAQHFTEKVGDPRAGNLQSVSCTTGAMPDPCAAAQAALPASY